VNVPGFIARQFYVAGSLRNTGEGWELKAQNPMGSGVLVGVGRLRVDGTDIPAEAVTAQRDGDAEVMSASDVSRERPVRVAKGDKVTLRVAGAPLTPGQHTLEVELFELNMGRLAFSISDKVSDPAG
jgi:hypothetical protein